MHWNFAHTYFTLIPYQSVTDVMTFVLCTLMIDYPKCVAFTGHCYIYIVCGTISPSLVRHVCTQVAVEHTVFALCVFFHVFAS